MRGIFQIGSKSTLSLMVGLLLNLYGCQNDTQLKKPFAAVVEKGTAIVEIIDELCTIQPEKLSSPRERLLYYLEYNDTTVIKDPTLPACPTCQDTTARVNMINNITVKLAAQQLDRQSAVFTFNDAITDRTGGLVDDPTGVAQTLVGSSGGTFSDVLDVIKHATDQVKSDALQNHNESFSRYNIFMVVSDLPNVDNNSTTLDPLENPTNILNEVDKLIDLQNTFGIFDVTLNIVLLATLTDNTTAAASLYSQMVNKTGGKFVIVMPTAGGPDAAVDINDFDFFNTLIPTLNLDRFMVINRNARLDSSTGSGQFIIDSDADGIGDDEEATLGTNPSAVDSDGDFFDDRVEQLLGTDPTVADHVCLQNDQVDSDGDGLIDCEELSLGFDPLQWDTDGDGMPDYLEIIYRTNPLQKDADDDLDQDGLSNIDEIKLGLDPLHADDQASQDFYSQGYEVEITSKPQEKVKCLKMTVKNVPLVHSLNSSRNVIEVQVQEVPDNPVPIKLLSRVFYLTDGTQDSDGNLSAIKIFIDPADFQAVEQKGD